MASPFSPPSISSRLEAQAADDLVQGLVGDANAELRALIVERTDGTPLFIEETVRTLVESGALRLRAGGYELTRQIPEIRIPETVQSVIAARIDSLSPKRKSLLQIASVIGSNIPIMLLREVVDLSEPELAEASGGAQGGAVSLRDAKSDIRSIEVQARAGPRNCLRVIDLGEAADAPCARAARHGIAISGQHA